MISTDGKILIKRYLANFVPTIAQSIAYGIGGKAEAVGDTKLQFEVGRADIVLTSYDFLNDRVVFKAVLPDTFSGTIYEAAIFSTPVDTVAGAFGSTLLASFESDTETWADPTSGTVASYTTANSRLGADSLRHTPAASTAKTDAFAQLSIDLGQYSGADKFAFAYNVGNGNTASIRFRFMTDSSNYYDFTITSPTSGYKVTELDKSTATATGTPSWSNITELRVTTTSGSGGASQVDFDGIRIEDVDTINPDYAMVARQLWTPVVKEVGKIQEVEFALAVNIT